jgi:death-on-curing protein
MSAAYTTGIIGNHPFVDGNKRTGFVVGILFLELNGYRFTASEEHTVRAVLSLAGSTLDEEGFVTFLRANTAPET